VAAYTSPRVRAPGLLSALLLLPALAAGEETSFWVLRFVPGRHPYQERVEARPLVRGERFAVFLAEGAPPPPAEALPPGGWEGVLQALEQAREILASQGADPAATGPVAIVVTETGWPGPACFSPFDKLPEQQALAYGFHSNQRPVLFASFPYRGGRAWENLAGLASMLFLFALLPPQDPFPAASSLAAASFFAFAAKLSPPRSLWGDQGPSAPGPRSWEPATPTGWGPLFVAFLADTLGPGAAFELVSRQNAPTGPYRSLVAAKNPGVGLADLFAAYMLRLWEAPGSPEAWQSPLGFALAASPRPAELARVPASKPASGKTQLGVGGMGVLVLEGDGSRSLPLALQGDPRGAWVAVMRKATASGLGEPVRLAFDATGFARAEVPALAPGEQLLVFVGLPPDPRGEVDRRFLPLYWGLAWAPKPPPERRFAGLGELVEKRLGDAAPARRSRVVSSLQRLAGVRPATPEGNALTTRYAWHPQAEQVAAALAEELKIRGLVPRTQAFLRTTPWGATAEWHNVLAELPGSASRRLPLVLAAHWDACASDPWESYRAARSLRDNGAGVVAVLEAGAALRGRPHQLPVVLALLAGGCHDAAGAQALLSALGGKVAVWVEVEQLLPPPGGDPGKLVAYLGETPSLAIPRLPGLFRRWGFAVDVKTTPPPPHTGASLVQQQGAMVLTVSYLRGGATEVPVSPEGELGDASPDVLLLAAEALAELVQELGGR
jgi:hypothetical protein